MSGQLAMIYQLMRADFYERTRRYSFMVTLGLSIFAGYSMMPRLGESYTAFAVGGCRGVYNSAWTGVVFGTVAVSMLTLFGFYLVRNTIRRDQDTRVGIVLASTPLGKLVYLVGKWLSNLAVLVVILAILSLVAVAMQLIRAEELYIDIPALLTPMWLISLPPLAIVAALALLFDSIRFLNGGFGSVLYFFIWVFALLISLGVLFASDEIVTPYNDFTGMSHVLADIQQAMIRQDLDPFGGSTDLYVPTGGSAVQRFNWTGYRPGFNYLLERISWCMVALLFVAAAIIPFRRFDPAALKAKTKKKKRRFLDRFRRGTSQNDEIGPAPIATPLFEAGNLTRTTPASLPARMFRLYLSELTLMLKSRGLLWMLALLIPAGFVLFGNDTFAYLLAYPAMLLFPTPLWSGLGSREYRYETENLVYTAPNAAGFQLAAQLMAGWTMLIIVSIPYLVRISLQHGAAGIAVFLAGSFVLPALALALGVWTRSGKLFELTWLILWYIGIFKKEPWFNFPGIPSAHATPFPAWYFSVVALVLFGAACLGLVLRRRR